jgi:endonuclease YncB( thermonuclease family)
MINLGPALAILFSAGFGLCLGLPLPPSIDYTVATASVTRAVDGDSLDARVDGMRTALGYVGVSAPSLSQPCGREALTRNQQLAGDQILLEPDAAYEFDDRGRRLYYAYTADGASIEETLVREGLAYAARTDAAHGAYLAELQAEASAAGVGCLWGGG